MTKKHQAEINRGTMKAMQHPYIRKVLRAQLAASVFPAQCVQMKIDEVKAAFEVADKIIERAGL